jgi:hypothetical protein
MRATETVGLTMLLAALAAGAAHADADYPEYRAAQSALERGDCPGARAYLEDFLEVNPRFREPRHRSFYLAVRRVMAECDGSIVIRGVGEDPGGLSPLPADPPPVP